MSEKMSEFIKSPIGKFAVGMLVVLVVGGIAAREMLKNKQVDNEITNTPPQQEQQVASPVNETVDNSSSEQNIAEESAETLPSVESLEIDASLMSNPEELEKAFISRYTEWYNAGATKENAEAAISSSEGPFAYAAKVAAPYDERYIDALFIDDWESVPSLVQFAERMKVNLHQTTLSDYFKTSFPNFIKEDIEPFRRWEEVISIDSVKTNKPDSWVVIDASQKLHYNEGKHHIHTDGYVDGVQSKTNHSTSSYVVVDGKVKLSEISNIVK